jgi:hypothetical protein
MRDFSVAEARAKLNAGDCEDHVGICCALAVSLWVLASVAGSSAGAVRTAEGACLQSARNAQLLSSCHESCCACGQLQRSLLRLASELDAVADSGGRLQSARSARRLSSCGAWSRLHWSLLRLELDAVADSGGRPRIQPARAARLSTRPPHAWSVG